VHGQGCGSWKDEVMRKARALGLSPSEHTDIVLAETVRYQGDTLQKVATGRRAVTPTMALRIARLLDVGVDVLLAGEGLSTRTCPHCGHMPDDFVDEETVAE
jgi:hypothetical protein